MSRLGNPIVVMLGFAVHVASTATPTYTPLWPYPTNSADCFGGNGICDFELISQCHNKDDVQCVCKSGALALNEACFNCLNGDDDSFADTDASWISSVKHHCLSSSYTVAPIPNSITTSMKSYSYASIPPPDPSAINDSCSDDHRYCAFRWEFNEACKKHDEAASEKCMCESGFIGVIEACDGCSKDGPQYEDWLYSASAMCESRGLSVAPVPSNIQSMVDRPGTVTVARPTITDTEQLLSVNYLLDASTTTATTTSTSTSAGVGAVSATHVSGVMRGRGGSLFVPVGFLGLLHFVLR